MSVITISVRMRPAQSSGKASRARCSARPGLSPAARSNNLSRLDPERVRHDAAEKIEIGGRARVRPVDGPEGGAQHVSVSVQVLVDDEVPSILEEDGSVVRLERRRGAPQGVLAQDSSIPEIRKGDRFVADDRLIDLHTVGGVCELDLLLTPDSDVI